MEGVVGELGWHLVGQSRLGVVRGARSQRGVGGSRFGGRKGDGGRGSRVEGRGRCETVLRLGGLGEGRLR